MLLSMNDEFHKNQSASLEGELVTATAFLTAVKDAGSARDWGAGELVIPYAFVTAAADFNPVTSATFDVIAGDNVACTTNPVTLSTSGAIAAAALVAGSFVKLPALLSGSLKRYLGMKVTVTGGNATTGAIKAGLMSADARRQSYGVTGGL